MNNKNKLTIRTIFSPSTEPLPKVIGIDYFNDVEKLKKKGVYKAAAYVKNDNGCILNNVKLDDELAIATDDEYKLPTMEMYIKLGEALRKKGMFFNKKKNILAYNEKKYR